MRLCAYCKSPGPLTREEIFPKFLSEKVGYTTFVDQTRDGAVLGPFTVRDVCEQCNGVRLSALDNYVASLYREYFSKPVDAPVDILFRYSYRLLVRWLFGKGRSSAGVHVLGCPSLAGRFWLSDRLFQRFLAGRFEVATTLANNEPLTPLERTLTSACSGCFCLPFRPALFHRFGQPLPARGCESPTCLWRDSLSGQISCSPLRPTSFHRQ